MCIDRLSDVNIFNPSWSLKAHWVSITPSAELMGLNLLEKTSSFLQRYKYEQ